MTIIHHRVIEPLATNQQDAGGFVFSVVSSKRDVLMINKHLTNG